MGKPNDVEAQDCPFLTPEVRGRRGVFPFPVYCRLPSGRVRVPTRDELATLCLAGQNCPAHRRGCGAAAGEPAEANPTARGPAARSRGTRTLSRATQEARTRAEGSAPGAPARGPRTKSWKALRIKVSTIRPAFQWKRGEAQQKRVQPEVDQAGEDEHAKRDPTHGAEAPPGLLHEPCPQSRVVQAAGHRHQHQNDEEHHADPDHGGHDMKPAAQKGHGSELHASGAHRPEGSTAEPRAQPRAQPREASPGLPRSEFRTDRTVAWYARAVERGDYAARVLEVLEPALADRKDALDVGAGCGALSLPLARRLETVTALEPSPAMARAPRAAAAGAGLVNVTVVEAAWGETSVRPHDLVLCAHVGGLLKAGSPFLRDAGTAARRWVALVRDVPGAQREDKFFFSELYPALLGRPYEHRCDAEETLDALRQLGIRPSVTDRVRVGPAFWGPRGSLRLLDDLSRARGRRPARLSAGISKGPPGAPGRGVDRAVQEDRRRDYLAADWPADAARLTNSSAQPSPSRPCPSSAATRANSKITALSGRAVRTGATASPVLPSKLGMIRYGAGVGGSRSEEDVEADEILD